MTLLLIGMPIVFLLLFVYVFGGTLGAGLGGATGGRAAYVEYVVPGSMLQTMLRLALTWLCVALGMSTKTVEAASNMPMPLMFLPFLGSGFVPTDSMPAGLGWFAEYQPFTPIIETVRGLLLGTAIGSSAVIGLAWCAGITLVSYVWARRLDNRDPVAR